MTGRTNAGSGGKMKIVTGKTTIKHSKESQLLTQVDFAPMIICTFPKGILYQESDSSLVATNKHPYYSYRESRGADFTTYTSGKSNECVPNSYEEGGIYARTSVNHKNDEGEFIDVPVEYVVMGV